jgi:hypothetical protein
MTIGTPSRALKKTFQLEKGKKGAMSQEALQELKCFAHQPY